MGGAGAGRGRGRALAAMALGIAAAVAYMQRPPCSNTPRRSEQTEKRD